MSNAVLTKVAIQEVLTRKGIPFSKSASKAQLELLYNNSKVEEPKALVGESITGEY